MRDFEQFARRMRLRYIFHRENSDPHPFHVKSDWVSPIEPSVTLESEKRLRSALRIFNCTDQKIICHTESDTTKNTQPKHQKIR